MTKYPVSHATTHANGHATIHTDLQAVKHADIQSAIQQYKKHSQATISIHVRLVGPTFPERTIRSVHPSLSPICIWYFSTYFLKIINPPISAKFIIPLFSWNWRFCLIYVFCFLPILTICIYASCFTRRLDAPGDDSRRLLHACSLFWCRVVFVYSCITLCVSVRIGVIHLWRPQKSGFWPPALCP